MSSHTDNHLFIAETPFQLFSALCFFEANVERFSQECVDIAIYAQFTKADAYVDALRESGVFRNVFYIRPYHEKVTREGLNYVRDILLFKSRSRRRFFEACPGLAANQYNHLYVAGATRFPLDVKQFCAQDARTVLFEDGAGSRNGAIYKAFLFMDPIETHEVSFSHEDYVKLAAKRVVDKLLKGKLRLGCDELWVFSPDKDFQKRLPEIEVHEIPRQCMRGDLIKSVMHADSPAESDANIIFFAAPLTTGGGIPELQTRIIELLEEKREWRAKVRRHPRGFDLDVPKALVTDDDDTCWEAVWGARRRKENMILMGFGSTAQLTPNTLFCEEPYQFFLHKLLPFDSPLKTAAQDVMNELARRYDRTDRILSPNSFDELIESVDIVLNECLQGSSL